MTKNTPICFLFCPSLVFCVVIIFFFFESNVCSFAHSFGSAFDDMEGSRERDLRLKGGRVRVKGIRWPGVET